MLIFNPETAPYGEKYVPPLQSAAQSMAVEGLAFRVHNLSEIENALTDLGRTPGGGLIVLPDAFTVANRTSLIRLAAIARLPAIYSFRVFAIDGGLISYGIDSIDLYRRSRILCRSNPQRRKASGITSY
jgi:putative ABC transport system substrate-binding protein